MIDHVATPELEWAALNAALEWRAHHRGCVICAAYMARPPRVSAPCWLGLELAIAADEAHRALQRSRRPALTATAR